jgi:RNA polymerase sigma factor (sigma-70 family)
VSELVSGSATPDEVIGRHGGPALDGRPEHVEEPAAAGGTAGNRAVARDGDRDSAVAALFAAQHLPLVRLATLLGADDAEDVVAEAFYQLYRRWRRLREEGAATAYLRSTVVNLTRMRIRHLQVARRHLADDPARPASVASGEEATVLRDDQRALVDAVRALPDRQREALVLRYWLDLR